MDDLTNTPNINTANGDEAQAAPAAASKSAPDSAARILESITDAFFALDSGWRFTYVNAEAERVLFRTREELLGKSIWDEFPEAMRSTFEREYRRAANEQIAVTFEEFFPSLSAWFEVRPSPSFPSLSVFFHDVTERVERRRRERFLADLAERARALTDPDVVIEDAVRSVGEFLGVSRCIFADIDIEADTCTIHPDYCADPSVASIEGVVPISAFGAFVVAEYAARRAVVVDDVRLDPVRAPEGSLAAYDAVGIRAHASVPVVHSSRLVSCIGAHSVVPRHWKLEEVELLRAVVERTWLTVEVLRQQRALVRGAETTARTMDSLTDAFFTLDREFRFTFVNRQAEAMWGTTRAEMFGRSAWEMFPDSVGGVFYHQYHRVMSEGVPESVEDFYPLLGAWLEVRAFPSPDGISVFFQNVTERKNLEAERERLAERARNIAQQLQAALTPAVPEQIPGMALAKHYTAALDEAGVGGDFYGVFPVDRVCTGLVVGDLAGKGLAAATQVATVRNMLRYALYRARTLAGALTGLNALLADHGLLTGFATLFVGTYDSNAGTLTYVNCGQEAALLRRAASGLVERLPPTGPVLGCIEGAAFEEQTIVLGPGDALAVFTDGLTEVGRSRHEMLDIEGVATLLEQFVVPKEAKSAASVAERLALGIIAGVDAAAAGGVMRDDVCLLVGVAEMSVRRPAAQGV